MPLIPTHDSAGLHILDPRDRRGYKSRYITLLQEKALRKHIPMGKGELAVDVGCGYGRLTPVLAEKGWQAIGIDPAPHLIEYARKHYPGPEYRLGGLPDLPLQASTVSVMLVQNVLRPLKMMGRLEDARGVGRYLAPGASVLLVENIRYKHPDFVPEELIVKMMQDEGLVLIERVPIRAGRWWVTYLIRFGLIPTAWFDIIAEWELKRMANKTGAPRHQYWNVLFVFRKGVLSP